MLKNFIGVKMILKLTNNSKSFLDKKTFSKGREILAYAILKKNRKRLLKNRIFEILRFRVLWMTINEMDACEHEKDTEK